jgi:glycosyltransferase involved in cell wall biosynthesis
LIEAGRTGLLVPAEDAAQLAGAIRAVLDNAVLAAGLAAAGREVWARDYAETPVLARWKETLELMVTR